MIKIDLRTETLIRLARAGRHLPPGPDGRPTAPSTLARWATRGVRGHRLAVIHVGGRVYTSLEALQRFADSLTRATGLTAEGDPPASNPREAVDAELDRLGF